MASDSDYKIYLVQCNDGSIYTGIATDVDRRFKEHEEGIRGAKFLRGKGPLKLLYQQSVGNRSLASRLEIRVKRLPNVTKQDLATLPSAIQDLLVDLENEAIKKAG